MKKIGFVILLTVVGSSGCALLSTEPTPVERDPIAEAALYGKTSKSEEEALRLRQYRLQEDLEIERALESGEVVLGMKMDDVISVWGQPRHVETAGDPKMGNQRWIYSDSLIHQWKLKSSRVVYFEEGKVVGWESGRN